MQYCWELRNPLNRHFLGSFNFFLPECMDNNTGGRIVPVAYMSGVATRAPEAFALVLVSSPPGGSGTMRWILIELVYGSSSQNK